MSVLMIQVLPRHAEWFPLAGAPAWWAPKATTTVGEPL